jgi:sterol desaturase/sphingolipid hydroxylase (fatty acid hydroxylase superfamily)
MDQLIQRVKAIILTPQTEWPVIAAEPGETAALFTRYVAILALIPAVCGFIGSALIGRYLSIGSALVSAIVGYVLTFVVVFVVALIVDALAPSFGTQKNFPNALKLTVYSYTPAWLAGIFQLIPGLSFLSILGLYGLYLMWLGLPPLMQVPREKALPYAAAVIGIALVIQIVIALILGLLFFSTR